MPPSHLTPPCPSRRYVFLLARAFFTHASIGASPRHSFFLSLPPRAFSRTHARLILSFSPDRSFTHVARIIQTHTLSLTPCARHVHTRFLLFPACKAFDATFARDEFRGDPKINVAGSRRYLRGDSRVRTPRVTEIFNFFLKAIVNIGLNSFGM